MKKNNTARGKKMNAANNGGKWIRQDKRLAIYLRDGLCCAYCGEAVEDGAVLTLDHIKPQSKGGSNHEKNLVTACKRCNSARGNRPLRTFARAVADYKNERTEAEIVRNIERLRNRKLDRAEAKAIIARRGYAAAAGC